MKAAFTLIELLVTLTIILVLAALSMAGLAKMRAAGDRVVATRNLSQLQLANISYANDNNGQFVPIYAFDGTGGKYVAWLYNPKFISCFIGDSTTNNASGTVTPTIALNMLDPTTVRAKKKGYDSLYSNFGYITNAVPGQGWGQPNTKPSWQINQLTAPERSACFITGTDWNISYANRFLWQGSAAVEGQTTNQMMAYRHNGKAIVAYYDGHVGEMSVADIKNIDALGGNKNIFWKGDAK